MNETQVKLFSSSILISDVISYIDAHKKEYEMFLKEEEQKEIIKKQNSKKRGNKKNES